MTTMFKKKCQNERSQKQTNKERAGCVGVWRHLVRVLEPGKEVDWEAAGMAFVVSPSMPAFIAPVLSEVCEGTASPNHDDCDDCDDCDEDFDEDFDEEGSGIHRP